METKVLSPVLTGKRKRSRKKKDRRSKQSRTTSSNPYSLLADEGEAEDEGTSIYSEAHSEHNEEPNNEGMNESKEKPPPLITTGNCNVNELMREMKITNYTYKQMTIGNKILLFNEEERKRCQRHLIDRRIEFYTHRARGNKVFKAVVYGLPQTDVNQLKVYFNRALNIKPLEIFEMNTKNKNIHNALYLFHFNKDEITMADLRKIKVINHTIVKWMPYSPKFKGPTQCRNCGMYGHGTENCHRNKICLLCASTGHNSKDCYLNQQTENTGAIFKCFNCFSKKLNHAHRANDPNCPLRKEYVGMRKSLNQRKTSPPTSKQTRFSRQSHDFPPLNHLNQMQFNRQPSTSTNTYANVMKIPTAPPATHQNSADLFSMSELLVIFNNAACRLKQCTSKIDQISVIATLLEYAV